MKKSLKKKSIDSVTVVLGSDSPVDSSEVRLRLSSREEFNFIVESANSIAVPAANLFSDAARFIERHGNNVSDALSHVVLLSYVLADVRRAEILSEGSSSQ